MSGEPTVRWQRRKDARPPEILAAALASFAERGFAATRLEDVAARAGFTKGTIYLYFPNKEELFKAVVRGNLVAHLKRFKQLAASQEPASSLLRRLTVYRVEVISTPVSAITKLVVSEASNSPDLARFYLDEVVRRGRDVVEALLRRV